MNYYKISQHAALANNPEFLGCITNGVGLKRQLNMTNEFLLPRFDPPPSLPFSGHSLAWSLWDGVGTPPGVLNSSLCILVIARAL